MNLTTAAAHYLRRALLPGLLALGVGLAGGGLAWGQVPKGTKGADKGFGIELTPEQLALQEQLARQQAQAQGDSDWIWITLGVLGGGAVVAVVVVFYLQQQQGGGSKGANPASAYRQAN